MLDVLVLSTGETECFLWHFWSILYSTIMMTFKFTATLVVIVLHVYITYVAFHKI